MTALTAPEGLIAIAGELMPRRRGFAHRSEAVKCLRGHVIEEQVYVHGWTTYRCGECDLATVVLSAPEGFQFRADVTANELTEMSARGWRLGEVLRYTGSAIGERVG